LYDVIDVVAELKKKVAGDGGRPEIHDSRDRTISLGKYAPSGRDALSFLLWQKFLGTVVDIELLAVVYYWV
jgi:hypothetical protein